MKHRGRYDDWGTKSGYYPRNELFVDPYKTDCVLNFSYNKEESQDNARKSIEARNFNRTRTTNNETPKSDPQTRVMSSTSTSNFTSPTSWMERLNIELNERKYSDSFEYFAKNGKISKSYFPYLLKDVCGEEIPSYYLDLIELICKKKNIQQDLDLSSFRSVMLQLLSIFEKDKIVAKAPTSMMLLINPSRELINAEKDMGPLGDKSSVYRDTYQDPLSTQNPWGFDYFDPNPFTASRPVTSTGGMGATRSCSTGGPSSPTSRSRPGTSTGTGESMGGTHSPSNREREGKAEGGGYGGGSGGGGGGQTISFFDISNNSSESHYQQNQQNQLNLSRKTTNLPPTPELLHGGNSTVRLLSTGTVKGTYQLPGYLGHMPSNLRNIKKQSHSYGLEIKPNPYTLRIAYKGLDNLPGYTGFVPNVLPPNHRKEPPPSSSSSSSLYSPPPTSSSSSSKPSFSSPSSSSSSYSAINPMTKPISSSSSSSTTTPTPLTPIIITRPQTMSETVYGSSSSLIAHGQGSLRKALSSAYSHSHS